MVALSIFVRRSRTGRAMQATAQDPDTAELVGIDSRAVYARATAIAVALAALGAAGRNRICEEFSIDRMVAAKQELYVGLVAGR
jgi:branched-subunit amino acid ABC-type transport system permease component